MIKRRPRPTVRSKSHRKINKYYDRKEGSENKLVHMMDKAMVPKVFGRGSSSCRKNSQVQTFMSDSVKVQCGKQFAKGEENKEQYSQKEIVEAALKELMEE